MILRIFVFSAKRKITTNTFFTQLLVLLSLAARKYKPAPLLWQPEPDERLVQKMLLSVKIGKISEAAAGLSDLFAD